MEGFIVINLYIAIRRENKLDPIEREAFMFLFLFLNKKNIFLLTVISLFGSPIF